MIGTSDQSCSLAETCKILLLQVAEDHRAAVRQAATYPTMDKHCFFWNVLVCRAPLVLPCDPWCYRMIMCFEPIAQARHMPIWLAYI